MPLVNENQLKRQIESGDLSRLYLLFGEEAYLKKHYSARIAKKAVAAGPEVFNVHRFDGDIDRIYDVFEAAETLPVMSPKTALIVRDMPLDSLKGADAERFYRLSADLPDTTVIIFWCDTVTFTSRKSEKWRGILDHIKKYGTAAELNKREAASITSVLCQGAARRGCSLDPAAARHLINTAGDDLNVLLNEIEKLCAYSGGAAITKEMIDAVAVKSLEASIFELSDAILLKDADRAFSILNVLLAKKTEPIMILGTLGSAYTDLYRAKLAVSSGKSARAAAEFFNYKNKEFRLDKAAAKTAKMPLEKIKYAINLLCEADAEMKSSSKPGALILEILTAKLLGV